MPGESIKSRIGEEKPTASWKWGQCNFAQKHQPCSQATFSLSRDVTFLMVSPLLGRFLVSFNLQSAICSLQSAVCGLQSSLRSAVCSLQMSYTGYRTSTLSFGGCLLEPKPILRYVLDKCLNVWINEDWENLELYHMKNNATENNY